MSLTQQNVDLFNLTAPERNTLSVLIKMRRYLRLKMHINE